MKRCFGKICLTAIILTFPIAAFSQSNEAIERTRKIVGEIIAKSYPELKPAKIDIKTFQSDSNYFKSQFSVSRFLTFQKLHYVVFVNPEVFRKNAPAAGIRAILAHELAHVLYYKRKNRFELVGLANLADKSFTVKFERRADLEAIGRGYGEGLKSYRRWLYENIPAKETEAKKRDYFSPEEIDLILKILREKPEMLDVWRNRPPRNFNEIRKYERFDG
jgi:hypothetical protein